MNCRIFPVTILSTLMLIPAVASADPREDLLQAIAKCAAIPADKDRLVCYDALSPHVRDTLNVPPPALSTPPTKEEEKSWFGFNLDNLFGSAPAQQTTPQQFGAERTVTTQQKVENVEQEIDSISAGVTDYSFTLSQRFIVFLDNGQVWREIQGDPSVAHFKRMPTDNTVTIERGLIGSYNMKINDGEKSFKVTRVK